MAVEDNPFCGAAAQEGGERSPALSPVFPCTNPWYVGRKRCSLLAYLLLGHSIFNVCRAFSLW